MKVIFLDIDDVLQPSNRQNRFDHLSDIPDLCKKLNDTIHNGFDYYAYVGGDEARDDWSDHNSQKCDIGAVYYDWNTNAVQYIKELIEKTGARIVLSSDWRQMGYVQVKALMDIHGLGRYLYDSTFYYRCHSNVEERYLENDYSEIYNETTALFNKLKKCIADELRKKGIETTYVNERVIEILEYLDRHQEITAFAVVDDIHLVPGLEDHFVEVYPNIEEEDKQTMLAMLNNENGPYQLPATVPSKELENWRDKWIEHGKQMFMNNVHYVSPIDV